ncbi:velvet factor-domain-containing protein [Mycena albidolilacea]|uniref:Velvet factor-domain-containing protein n=1 Tax=Mycena albidolilacea TaxID=1033008 RepID=A0AAD6ZKQ4_9AGAR|nr:velvet factor-domain-containing protein [Mycena albidolilacea]
MIPAPSQQTGEPHHRYPVSQQQTASLVGRPIHFTEGQFAGKTIRAKLQELQAAAFGRKYAKVDRRPLDPPPVAWLRLFEVFNAMTEAETEVEIDYDNIHILGLMCTVDLIPVAGPDSPSTSSPPTTPGSNGSFAHSPYSPQSPNGNYGFGSPISPQQQLYSAPSSPGMDHSYGLGEGSPPKATNALAGTTFVQVDSIPWKGQTCLLFTFADLAVKTEGYFILQYRFFDLFSRPTGHADQPIQADCCGRPFRIYSSKEVPPLGKSTELTKHLARYGVRVNVRETERKRKKKEPVQRLSPPYTTRRIPGHGHGHDRALSDGTDDDDDD